MNIILYTRVSTQEQGNSRNGLEGQLAAMQRFATANDLTILLHVEEVASGALEIDERPGLAQALNLCRKHKATLLVSKLDRLSRDAALILDLMKRQVRFATAEDGLDVDPLMLQIKAVFAEKERKLIGERTRTALAAKKARGECLGMSSPKYTQEKRDRTLAAAHAGCTAKADEFATRVAPDIRMMQSSGLTLQQIADRLNALAVRTARGGQWYAPTVCNVLKRTRVIVK